jgi:microsomal prostaglandin-E synthase 2
VADVCSLSTKSKLAKMGYETNDPKAGLNGELTKWCTSFPPKHRYHGGQQPDLADSDVFGIIRSIQGHDLYQEVASVEPCRDWINAMQLALEQAKAKKQ